jgi:hypothetical protein
MYFRSIGQRGQRLRRHNRASAIGCLHPTRFERRQATNRSSTRHLGDVLCGPAASIPLPAALATGEQSSSATVKSTSTARATRAGHPDGCRERFYCQ